jgi:hypothetical protein
LKAPKRRREERAMRLDEMSAEQKAQLREKAQKCETSE